MRTLISILVTATVMYFVCRRKPQPAARLVFSKIEFHDTGLIIEGDISMVRLNPNQKVTLTAAPRDRHGNEAGIEPGSSAWDLADDSIGTLTPNPDNELEAEFVSNSVPCQSTVSLTADGRVGEGEREITGVETIVVAAEDAVVFELAASEPTDV
jgi:hypothetical protein